MAPTPSSPTPSSTTLARATMSSTSLAIPQAPPAGSIYSSSTTDGWSPAAIIGIVTAVVVLCLSVPLVAVILRRYQKKRLRETLPRDCGSSKASLRSVKEDQSLKSILVTRELQRMSLRVGEGGARSIQSPEKAHVHEKGWSRTEVRGGERR